MSDVPGEDNMVAHAQPIPQRDIEASRAMYADAQIGPTDLTKLEPKDVAVPEPWPDERPTDPSPDDRT